MPKLPNTKEAGFFQKGKKALLLWGKRVIKGLSVLLLLLSALVIGINAYLVFTTRSKIIDMQKAKAEDEKENFDYIVVLGAGVRPGGVPSRILKERIDKGVEAYEMLSQAMLLMSGDSATPYYKETVVMEKEAVAAGVPLEKILQDPYGISTYDSFWRLKHIYGAKKVLIVTQKYHLSRSLYLANAFGIEAYGMDAQKVRYSGQILRDLREVAARTKELFKAIIKPDAVYSQ